MTRTLTLSAQPTGGAYLYPTGAYPSGSSGPSAPVVRTIYSTISAAAPNCSSIPFGSASAPPVRTIYSTLSSNSTVTRTLTLTAQATACGTGSGAASPTAMYPSLPAYQSYGTAPGTAPSACATKYSTITAPGSNSTVTLTAPAEYVTGTHNHSFCIELG